MLNTPADKYCRLSVNVNVWTWCMECGGGDGYQKTVQEMREGLQRTQSGAQK